MFVFKLVLSTYLLAVTYADKNSFEAIFERAELAYIAKEYWTANIQLPKVNRTTYALSINFTIFKDIPTDVIASGMVYAFYSNQYKRTAASYSNMNLCHLIELTKDTVERYVPPNVQIPRKCPIKKGSYFVKEYTFSTDSMENLPWNKVKMELNLTLNHELLLSFVAYFTLDRDIMYRKPFMNNMNLFH